jgi:hypothetical protein
VKLISPEFVHPFVKSNKNGFVDAESICEAATHPSMSFVTPKNEAQHTLSPLYRVREIIGARPDQDEQSDPRVLTGDFG